MHCAPASSGSQACGFVGSSAVAGPVVVRRRHPAAVPMAAGLVGLAVVDRQSRGADSHEGSQREAKNPSQHVNESSPRVISPLLVEGGPFPRALSGREWRRPTWTDGGGHMTGAVLIRWGGQVPGREAKSLEVFGKSIERFEQLTKEGRLHAHREYIALTGKAGASRSPRARSRSCRRSSSSRRRSRSTRRPRRSWPTSRSLSTRVARTRPYRT